MTVTSFLERLAYQSNIHEVVSDRLDAVGGGSLEVGFAPGGGTRVARVVPLGVAAG